MKMNYITLYPKTFNVCGQATKNWTKKLRLCKIESIERETTMTKASGSFHEKDNRSAEQQKIIELPNVIGNKDGERHFKTNVIKANAHKYSVSAMCKVLNIPRSTYYYKVKQKTEENGLTTDKTLETFHIDCLLSKKGCPYDNAAAEATFKIIKAKFVKGQNMKHWNNCNMNYRIL